MNGNNAQSPLLTDRFQTTYRNNPGRRLAIGLIALVVGLGLLWWAVVEVRLWVVLVGGGLMTVGGVGLLIDLIRDRLDRDVPLAVNGIVGLGLLVAWAALVWSSDGWDLPYLAVIAVVATLFALAPLGVVAKAVARQGTVVVRRRWTVRQRLRGRTDHDPDDKLDDRRGLRLSSG